MKKKQDSPGQKEVKRVRLSSSLPKSIADNASVTEDKEAPNTRFKEYLGRVMDTEQVEDIIQDQIKYKPLQLVNMVQKEKEKTVGSTPFLPPPKHVKAWTIKQLPEPFHKLSVYQGLHQLWLDYVKSLLDVSKTEDLTIGLARADYHGALMTVKQSKCSSLVGITGIVIHESAHVFSMICTDDKARCIIKRDSVFSVSCHGITFLLYGKHINMSPADRSTKKFKPRNTIELV